MFNDALVLLAEQNSFCASYVAQVVQQAGARVAGPFADSDAVVHWLEQATERPAAVLLSSDLQEAQLRLIRAQLELLAVPYIVVSEHPAAKSFMNAAFHWPFAGFQIAQALQSLIEGAAGMSQRPAAPT